MKKGKLGMLEKSLTNQTYQQCNGDIKRIALISHNYNKTGKGNPWDYKEYFHTINKICDDAKCDTILYSLWTWDEGNDRTNKVPYPFKGLNYVKKIILEAGRLSANNNEPKPREDLTIESWEFGKEVSNKYFQEFTRSSERTDSRIKSLLNELKNRKTGNGLIIICGETNLVSLKRSNGAIHDEHQVNKIFDDLNVNIILNPIHNYMTRYEMKIKRAYYSLNKKTVISVWNQGKDVETKIPWTVFHDGKNYTNLVQNLNISSILPNRSDIMIGIMSIDLLP